MTKLEKQIEAWHDKSYGPDVNKAATYRKLLEEVGELGEAIMLDDAVAIADESGDVGFVLAHIVRACCPDNPSLVGVIKEALEKCETRRRFQRR